VDRRGDLEALFGQPLARERPEARGRRPDRH
jgi:hypothetical protein